MVLMDVEGASLFFEYETQLTSRRQYFEEKRESRRRDPGFFERGGSESFWVGHSASCGPPLMIPDEGSIAGASKTAAMRFANDLSVERRWLISGSK
jgi:hypothetical protein